jgi:hypothetical protein
MNSELAGLIAFTVKYGAPLIGQRLRAWLLTFALGLTGAAIASPATARTVYDGTWSVLIFAKGGGRDRAYRSIPIGNDQIAPEGVVSVDLQARVARARPVPVSISVPAQRAGDFDRLHRLSDGRLWRDQGATGTWDAERRE